MSNDASRSPLTASPPASAPLLQSRSSPNSPRLQHKLAVGPSPSPSATPSSEKRDPFKSLIKPFFRRGTTNPIDSFRDSLKFSRSHHLPFLDSNHALHPLPRRNLANPAAGSSSASLNLNPASKPSDNPPDDPSSFRLLYRRRGKNSGQIKHPVTLHSSPSRPHPSIPQIIPQDTPHPSFSSNLSPPPTAVPAPNPDAQFTIDSPQANFCRPFNNEPTMLSPLALNFSPQSPTSFQLASSEMARSIHFLLTQPALVTLAQLAPAQLLSGVHSSCFGSSDTFTVFGDRELARDKDEDDQSQSQLAGQLSTDPDQTLPVDPDQHPLPARKRRLPTTIEQLSASSIALPITSISSIWRVLNCIEWINLKERQLINPPPEQCRINSYSSFTPSRPPTIEHADRPPDNSAQNLGSFDLANTLQHVGDILSAISSESDVEIVFYHIFYPPKPEAIEPARLHAQPTDLDQPDPSFQSGSEADSATAHHSFTADQPAEGSNPFLGAGADGEGGLREISVKADEKGLIIGLTCLLRQILHRAKRSSTIEVGLHLTPLYQREHSEMTEGEDSSSIKIRDDNRLGESSAPRDSGPSSWKCVFDVSLLPPVSPKPTATSTQNPTASKTTQVKPEESESANSGVSTPSKSASEHRTSIGAEMRASATLARLRMSSNLTSELPQCPEESLSKIIFEKLLGMKLSTGRLTSSGHSWKVTGIFEKGIDREVEENGPPKQGTGASAGPSREPTAEELTTFAETALRGKKAVLFAAEQSIFAKHITTYLTSWNVDVSHMPYEGAEVEEPHSSEAQLESGNESSLPKSDSAAEMHKNSLTGSSAQSAASSVNHGPPGSNSSTKSIRSNSFIIIDDDIATLKAQLVMLKNSPIASIHLPSNVIQNKHQSTRPPMSRRVKSSAQIERLKGSPKQVNTSIIHFTSISNFRKVQEIIRTHLIGAQWPSIPDVLVIPKPIGPRRVLTSLHTAVTRPLTEPQFVPIATSPSSPGTPHYFSHHAHPLGASHLGRTSPANYLGVTDFDTAAGNHLKNEQGVILSPVETASTAKPPSIHSVTPPGLRTPGTAPGTPAVPSPALLSHEALEYFSKAASENGGSSSTGVVLQSPDGRPQAMFFHHSSSSSRSRTEGIGLAGHTYLHSLQSAAMVNGALGRSSSGRRKGESRRSLSRSMVREMDGGQPDLGPKSLAQQVMAQADASTSASGLQHIQHSIYSRDNPSSLSVRTSRTASQPTSGEGMFSHAMALDKFEAISPRTPTVACSSEGSCGALQSRPMLSSPSSASTPTQTSLATTPVSPQGGTAGSLLSQLTREQQHVLMNPRPVPMLRMPSIPASLPNSISVTLPSPRRLTVSQFNAPKHSPPSPAHRVGSIGELGPKSEAVGGGTGAGAKSTSVLAMASRRRASMGDTIGASRLGRKRTLRKPTATLVPPINVLIVEDNRINQTILTTFMRKKSVKYDVAMNGQEAVDKWRTGRFHLVLMDLQLPVKDGIEATKEIREAERAVNINAFANTPPAASENTLPALGVPHTAPARVTPHNVSVIIVALTASSLDVDREVALAAGCNDFLTKPVSLAWLEKKLLEWGSMAWLSGFSRPPSTHPLNRSMPASSSASAAVLASMPPKPLSFTGSVAQRKARDVAEHLHLRFSKPGRQAVEAGTGRVRLESVSDQSGAEEDPARIAIAPPVETPRGSPESAAAPVAPATVRGKPRIALQVPTPERASSMAHLEPTGGAGKLSELPAESALVGGIQEAIEERKSEERKAEDMESRGIEVVEPDAEKTDGGEGAHGKGSDVGVMQGGGDEEEHEDRDDSFMVKQGKEHVQIHMEGQVSAKVQEGVENPPRSDESVKTGD